MSANIAKSDSKLLKKKPSSLHLKRQQRLERRESFGALEELIQCGICLEKLAEPKMLPCQHTFCLGCLQSHLNTNKVLIKQQSLDSQSALAKKPTAIKCPVCQKKIELQKGADSLEELPKNLYIDSVLKLVEGNDSPVLQKFDNRCVKCQILSEQEIQCCHHCAQVFCKVCWSEHLSELQGNLALLLKQVEESKVKLDHKLESFENRCQHLEERIKEATLQKIDLLKMDEEKVLKDVAAIVTEGNTVYESINKKIDELKSKLTNNSHDSSQAKVLSFMNYHKETSRLLTLVSHFGEARVIFDPESFRLDQTAEGIYCEIDDEKQTSPNFKIDKFEVAGQQYKNRSFAPKLVWSKCPRPANVAVSPWDAQLLYIAATDTHNVLILNRNKRKLQGRLTSPEMLYPQGIAFSRNHQEIFVSDKWKHCIHVFSKNGDYVRSMLTKGNGNGKVRSPDGIAMGPNEELVISDTGNDRIIVVNSQSGDHLSTIGIVDKKTMLNMPTGLTVTENKIVVADTGNHRIKIFGLDDGKKIHEFGSLGKGRGQFRSAEVVTVDPYGLILVGDGGNSRVQVFKPDGTVVKIFGSDGFGWVSGICVTNEFHVIVADSKSRCLKFF